MSKKAQETSPKAKRKRKAKSAVATVEKQQEPTKIGRPSSYTQEIADEICARLASGESLRTVCKSEHMPSAVTVFAWIRKHQDFLKQYEKAKQESADAMSEEMMDIADDGLNDWMESHDKEGNAIGWKLNGEHVQRSRLRIDTRKWLASKLKPKKYGERMATELSGPDGGPIETKELGAEELGRRIAFALAAGMQAGKPA